MKYKINLSEYIESVRESLSERIQEICFARGISWNTGSVGIKHTDKPYLLISDNHMLYDSYSKRFNNSPSTEISPTDFINKYGAPPPPVVSIGGVKCPLIPNSNRVTKCKTSESIMGIRLKTDQPEEFQPYDIVKIEGNEGYFEVDNVEIKVWRCTFTNSTITATFEQLTKVEPYKGVFKYGDVVEDIITGRKFTFIKQVSLSNLMVVCKKTKRIILLNIKRLRPVVSSGVSPLVSSGGNTVPNGIAAEIMKIVNSSAYGKFNIDDRPLSAREQAYADKQAALTPEPEEKEAFPLAAFNCTIGNMK